MPIITQSTLKLIKNLFWITLILGQMAWAKEQFKMQNSNGVTIEVDLALTLAQHSKGVSGLSPKDFGKSRGMLFVNPEVGPRRFWMPDTHFNLDIIFLDPNLRIVAIEKNAPAHPGFTQPPAIYKTGTYEAQFVLETRADGDFSKNLKINDKLKFIGPTSLSEIALKTHRKQ